MNKSKKKNRNVIKPTKVRIRWRSCCVPDCLDVVSTRFCIPTDKRINQIWLNRIQHPKLLSGQGYLRNYAVCCNHFASICIQNGKLKKYSLPTLNLPGYNNTDTTVENCFSYPPNNYELLKPTVKLLPDILAPPTVAVEEDIKPVLRPQRQYPGKRKHLGITPTIKEKSFIKLEASSDSKVPQFDSVEMHCKLEDMQNWEDNFHSDYEIKTELHMTPSNDAYYDQTSSDCDDTSLLCRRSISSFDFHKKYGRKKNPIVRKDVFLLSRNDAQYFPSVPEVNSLNNCGLGKRGNVEFSRSWSYEEIQTFIYSLYEDVPLELIGFKFAKCTTHRKLIRLDHVCNMEDIISEINQGCLVCIPNQDIPKIERDTGDEAVNQESSFNASSSNPAIQDIKVIAEEVYLDYSDS